MPGALGSVLAGREGKEKKLLLVTFGDLIEQALIEDVLMEYGLPLLPMLLVLLRFWFLLFCVNSIYL